MLAPTRLTRSVVAAGLGLVVLGGSAAFAADAPRTTAASSTFFLRQEGCGGTAEAGRLEPKSGADGATGCGTIGGVPLAEAQHATGAEIFAVSETYDTVGKGLPIGIDSAKKVTGQVAAGSWYGAGGAGTVTWDVSLIGATTAGKSIDFGETTVSAAAGPDQNVVVAPFTLDVPATAKGAALKSLSMTVVIRGANFGMSSYQLDGDSYLVIPTKPLPKKKK